MTDSNTLEINLEEIAEAIEILSRIGDKLTESRLTERAVVLLIRDASGVNKGIIRKVLKALPELRTHYLKEEE